MGLEHMIYLEITGKWSFLNYHSIRMLQFSPNPKNSRKSIKGVISRRCLGRGLLFFKRINSDKKDSCLSFIKWLRAVSNSEDSMKCRGITTVLMKRKLYETIL